MELDCQRGMGLATEVEGGEEEDESGGEDRVKSEREGDGG